MSQTFYRVTTSTGDPNGVAAWDDDVHMLFIWLPNTRSWHRNRSLEVDYLSDQEQTYDEISPTQASEIAAAMKNYDARSAGWLIEQYRAQPATERRTHAELGIAAEGRRSTLDPKVVESLQETTDWVKVAAYGPDGAAAAKALASDIRQGKRKRLAAAGSLLAQTVTTPDGIEVQARRKEK